MQAAAKVVAKAGKKRLLDPPGAAGPDSAGTAVNTEMLDEGEFEIEKLVDRKLSNRTGGLEYRVRWTDYDEDADRWLPADALPVECCCD